MVHPPLRMFLTPSLRSDMMQTTEDKTIDHFPMNVNTKPYTAQILKNSRSFWGTIRTLENVLEEPNTIFLKSVLGGGDKIWKSKFEKSNIHLTFHGYVETLFILLVPHFFWKKNPTRAKKPILSNFHRFCLENIHLKSLIPFFLILKAF